MKKDSIMTEATAEPSRCRRRLIARLTCNVSVLAG